MVHSFRPGEVWLDTAGAPIQAHGGGILHHEGVYYWYGENKEKFTADIDGGERPEVLGMSCYSSADLYNWKNEGIVLAAVNEPGHDLHPSGVLERPKVIYDAPSGRFVMWMHVDSPDYSHARAGVAASDSPTGPFRYEGCYRPNGGESRDMTVFQDDDGAAYLYHSSEGNATLHCARLAPGYLKPDGTFTRNFEKLYREAPAIFKRGDRYHMVSSYCTGWAPNEAGHAVAKSPMGPWEMRGNPCKGKGSETTFDSQSAFILPVQGKQDAYIFMADRWKPDCLSDSRYVWLPIRFSGDDMSIEWLDEWTLDEL
jgi:hypothetical protein